PAVEPIVQLPTVAMPWALVVRLSPVTVPPPTAANVTATPPTGFPLASVTMTEGAGDTVPPAGVLPGTVLFASIEDAPPDPTLKALLVAAERPLAVAMRV